MLKRNQKKLKSQLTLAAVSLALFVGVNLVRAPVASAATTYCGPSHSSDSTYAANWTLDGYWCWNQTSTSNTQVTKWEVNNGWGAYALSLDYSAGASYANTFTDSSRLTGEIKKCKLIPVIWVTTGCSSSYAYQELSKYGNGWWHY